MVQLVAIEFIGVIKRIGKSVYIRVDRKIAKTLELKDGDLVKVKMWRVKLVVEEFEKKKEKKKMK